MTRRRNGKTTRQAGYQAQLRAAIRKYLPRKGLPLASPDHRVRWTPRLLAMGALLLSWSRQPAMLDAFAEMRRCVVSMYKSRKRPGETAKGFFKALRQLCDDNGLLLIFDEVQTGMGRTGDLFAYKRLGVVPDVMPLAKALGGGFPIGACLASAEAASGMTPGSHGSTFGGNPLAVAAANAVLDVMLKPGFFEHVQKMSLLLKQKLASVVDRYPQVLAEVRGEGLLVGVKAVVPSGDLVTALREQKLLTVGAGDNVVRFLAPLIVSEAEIEESVSRLERACIALSGDQLKKAAG